MKPNQLIVAITILILTTTSTLAQNEDIVSFASSTPTNEISDAEKKHLNFFIVTKRTKGKLDLATRFNVLRAKLKGVLRKKEFIAVVARNASRMSTRVEHHLKKHNAQIGTIWFDSHGQYKKGYSLFFIGKDEYSYKTINDSAISKPLEQLAPYSDNKTKFIIGSCYGGATYKRPSIDYKDTTRMNGDSLMIAIGKIFKKANIYGSESWVMTKPGLFRKKAAVGGFPGRKLFRDYCYQPAWENVGKWNFYDAGINEFKSSNPIAMDKFGNIVIRGESYVQEKDLKKDLLKNLQSLETGLYK